MNCSRYSKILRCMYILEKGAPSFYADKDTVLCVAFCIKYSHMQNRVNV